MIPANVQLHLNGLAVRQNLKLVEVMKVDDGEPTHYFMVGRDRQNRFYLWRALFDMDLEMISATELFMFESDEPRGQDCAMVRDLLENGVAHDILALREMEKSAEMEFWDKAEVEFISDSA